MALRSLEASQKAGRAPFFDYKRAREDLERISKEFRTYLGAEGSPARAAAVPLVIDGRYFAESIKNYLLKEKAEPAGAASVSRGPAERQERQSLVTQPPDKLTLEPGKKEAQVDELKEEGEWALPSPPKPVEPQSGQSKRDKIGDILKKGL